MKVVLETPPCCAQCKFAQVIPVESYLRLPRLHCRRYPPSVWPDAAMPEAVFPQVTPEQWCGEFIKRCK